MTEQEIRELFGSGHPAGDVPTMSELFENLAVEMLACYEPSPMREQTIFALWDVRNRLIWLAHDDKIRRSKVKPKKSAKRK